MLYFRTTAAGDIVNRFSKDLQDIDIHLPTLLENTMASAVAVLAVVLLIAFVTPFALLLVLPAMEFYRRLSCSYAVGAREAQRFEAESRTPIIARARETSVGLVSIRAFQSQSLSLSHFHSSFIPNHLWAYFVKSADAWLQMRLGIVTVVILSGVSLSLAFSESLGISLSLSMTSLLLTYILVLMYYMNWMVQFATQTESKCASLQRFVSFRLCLSLSPFLTLVPVSCSSLSTFSPLLLNLPSTFVPPQSHSMYHRRE